MNIEDILYADTPLSCPNAETLENYISGKLSSAAQHEVERHVVECLFCEEALEGLRTFKVNDRLSEIRKELESDIDRRIQSLHQDRLSVLFPWKIAAAFALLIGSMALLWFFTPRMEPDQLFTQEFKPYPAPATDPNKEIPVVGEDSINDKFPAGKEKTVAEATVKDAPLTENVKSENNIAESTHGSVPEVSSVAEDVHSSESIISKSAQEEVYPTVGEAKKSRRVLDISDAKGVKESENSAVSEGIPATSTATSQSREKQASSRKRSGITAPSDDYEAGISAYQNQNYSLAISYLRKLKEPSDARFYLGLSLLASEQPATALEQFKLYLQSKGSTKREAGYWYAALAAIKLDKKREARYLLQKVIPFHGEFELEAAELLKKL